MSTMWDLAVRAVQRVHPFFQRSDSKAAYYCGVGCAHTACKVIAALADEDLLAWPYAVPPADPQPLVPPPAPWAREHPLPGNKLLKISPLSGDYSGSDNIQNADLDTANVLSSQVVNGKNIHRPVLDIDLPVTVLPSSTPGHCHLLIDTFMTWDAYAAILQALAKAGVIEVGYRRESMLRGFTAIRLPWIKKETERELPF